MTDLKNAVVGLRASAGTSCVAWIVLTMAIAAATVTYSVVDHVVLRPLAVDRDDRLIVIGRSTSRGTMSGAVAPQDYFLWKDRASSLHALGAGAGRTMLPLGGGSDAAMLVTDRITASLFDVLGVRPALGSGFAPGNEFPGSDRVALISDATWRTHFGADPGIIGRIVAFGQQSRQIVGVMPPEFTWPADSSEPADLWIPYVPTSGDRSTGDAARRSSLHVVARLRDDVSVGQAQAEMERILSSDPTATASWKDARLVVSSLRDSVIGPAKNWMLLVLCAVLVVLVIACTNVANLLLVRSTARRRELGVRAALGASPGRLLRVAMIESLLVSIPAVAAGLLVSTWGISIAVSLLPEGIGRTATIALDARVLGVAIGTTLVTGLLSGSVPAWYGSRTDPISLLRGSSSATTVSSSSGRWRAGLVVAEIGFVVTAVFLTAVFVVSFERVVSTDMGIAWKDRAAFVIAPSVGSLPAEQRTSALAAQIDDALDRVSRTPGVLGAAVISGGPPLSSTVPFRSVSAGGQGEAGATISADMRSVTPSYLKAAGLRLVAGRFIDRRDQTTAPGVVVLNEVAARQLFSDGEAVGRTVSVTGTATVIGVVGAIRQRGPEVEARPEGYRPLAQDLTTGGMLTVVVHTARPAASASAAILAALAPVLPPNGRPPVSQDLEATFREMTAQRRFSAGLLSVLGGLALAIGAIGVYGIMAFLVVERSREFGVRMALGASRGSILRSVLARGGRYLAAGLAVGLGGAWVTSRLVASVVVNVAPTDVVVLTTVVGIISATVLMTTLFPAARAARLDATRAVRMD
jgi:predicted permease